MPVRMRVCASPYLDSPFKSQATYDVLFTVASGRQHVSKHFGELGDPIRLPDESPVMLSANGAHGHLFTVCGRENHQASRNRSLTLDEVRANCHGRRTLDRTDRASDQGPIAEFVENQLCSGVE